MKKLVLLLFVGALFGQARLSDAQERIAPPVGNAKGIPSAAGSPRMELPSIPETGSGTRGEVYGLEPIPEPIASGELSAEDLQPNLQPYGSGDDYQTFNYDPALLESTGTWLRRGFWYTEVDLLLMDLLWRRDDQFLALQFNDNGTINNGLVLQGGRAGAEIVPRIKLGKFLFRDHKNRDHTVEGIFYGGGEWTRGGRLDAVNGGTLTVNPRLTGGTLTVNGVVGGNPSFSGATSMQFDYDTRFNSFEMNYHVRSRMDRDRMEMEPSGQWVRRAQPTVSKSLMAGIRYIDLNESFDWDAFGIDDDDNPATDPQSGTMRNRADNELFGSQVGGSWTYETARWSFGLQTKTGMFLNRSDLHSQFNITGGISSGNNRIKVDNISFLTEGSFVGKWHLSPNFSLRAGGEIMYLTSIVHATEQINFTPVATSANVSNGDSPFMGALIGFEGYW